MLSTYTRLFILLVLVSMQAASAADLLNKEAFAEGQRWDGESARLYSQGRFKEAIVPLEKATECYKKGLGPNHRWVGDNYTHLGNMYFNLKDYKNAEAAYKAALKIFETSNGSCQMGDAIKNYATILRSSNRIAEAEKLEKTQASCPAPEEASKQDTSNTSKK